MIKDFEGYEFKFVEKIEPKRDETGNIKISMPQQSYSEANQSDVHEHGWGPFCKFSISREWEGLTGVYIYLVDGKPKYVGEAEDLRKRVNRGYGNISPRNCFKGGQRTNCRINNNIFEAARNGKEIELYFCETDERKGLEEELIHKIKPECNSEFSKSRTKDRTNTSTGEQKSRSYSGKYTPIGDYLKKSSEETVELSFEEIEEILGEPLPDSAKTYKAWWYGDDHSQTGAWTSVGYTAKPDFKNEKVFFRKKDNN